MLYWPRLVYKVRPESNRTYEERYGRWNNVSGLVDSRSTKVIANRRKNFQKEDLIVSVNFITNAGYEHVYTYKCLVAHSFR